MGILQRASQYATKADFRVLSHEVKTHINHLDQKVTQFEARMSSELADIKSTMNNNMDHCKNEFSRLRADVAVLTNSHKYVLWIGGGLATMCMGVFGLCISILLPLVKVIVKNCLNSFSSLKHCF
ncbi:MAG: hypothetical protein NBV66_08945 [Burkholderiaceae bacterium]|nr:hypothetical protein [Burkholderiaceae bacterium]